MPRKNNLPLILAGIVILVVIYFLFMRNTGSSGDLPLGLNEKDKLKSGSGFRSVSRFGEELRTKTIEGEMANYKKNPKNPTHYLYPGQPDWDSTYFSYYLFFTNKIAPLLTEFGMWNKIYEVYGLDNITGVVSEVPISKTKEIIDNLTIDQKKLIYSYFTLLALAAQDQLTKVVDICSKTGSPCSEYQKTGAKALKNYLQTLNYAFNTDIVNNVPKVGAGWDEYKISDNLAITGKVDLTPDITYNSKKIKLIALKFFGSEKSNTTPGTVTVKVSGTDSTETAFDKSFTTDLSYSFDFTVFYPNVFFLPLDYPVTISDVSISVDSPGGGSFQNGSVLFTYE